MALWAIQRTLTQDYPKNLHENCIKGRTSAKGSMRGGDKKVYGQNTKTKSQKLLGHPLTLETHLRNKHFCPTCPKKKGKRSKFEQDIIDTIQRTIKIDKKRKTKRHIRY